MARKRKATAKKEKKAPSNAKNDAYTGMLTMSLLALAGGCVLLYLDYQKYGENKKPPTVQKVPLVTVDDLEAKEPPPVDPNAPPPGGNPDPNAGMPPMP